MADTVTWTCVIEFILRLLRGACGCHKQQLSSPMPMREEPECSHRHACTEKKQQHQHLMKPESDSEPEIDMVG